MADDKEEAPESPEPDIYFEPLVNLPPVEIKTLEEDEDELLKIRAKLFRYDSASDPAEWKERGVGDVKILRNKQHNTCRVLMRRDKTLKICANHYVLPQMELKPNCGSERAWVWSTPSDFADEEPKSELLAIRFANADNAQKFKSRFEEAQKIMSAREKPKDDAINEKTNGVAESKDDDKTTGDKDTDDVADKLGGMSVKDNKDTSSEKPSEKEESPPESNKDPPTDSVER